MNIFSEYPIKDSIPYKITAIVNSYIFLNSLTSRNFSKKHSMLVITRDLSIDIKQNRNNQILLK